MTAATVATKVAAKFNLDVKAVKAAYKANGTTGICIAFKLKIADVDAAIWS